MNKPTLLGSQLLTGNLCKSLSFAMLLCITFSQPVLAQEKQRMLRILTVTGRGVESIPATLAEVVLGVEVQAKTAQEAQKEAARRSSAVVTLLKTRNVEKLQTTGITLNPVYSYKDNIQRLTGYSASNTVSFRIATDKAGQLLDEAVKAGATQISGISFVATDQAIAQAQKQALKEATQEAQQQAEAVFSVLGVQRKEVVSIQINGASAPPPPPRPMFREAAVQTANASTPVEGGEQQVEASVTLEISY